MILVNNPGSEPVYAPLDHAPWFGWTPTDLIFPFFLFIVGTALAYSFRKYRPCGPASPRPEGFEPRRGSFTCAAIAPAVYWRIARRTITLMLLGWGTGLFVKLCSVWFSGATSVDLSTLRLPGVLVRIALVYFAASLVVLHVPLRGQLVIAAALLLGYSALLRWTPNPNDYQANLSQEGNIVRVVDRALIGDAHLYTQGQVEKTDPEGLLSTLPAIVTTLLGYWSGLAIQRYGINARTVALLAVVGALCVGIGLAWNETLPIGKKLWTSSFVMLTGGLAMIALAACLALFDVTGWRRLARPLEIVGVNAIFVFVASGWIGVLLNKIQVQGHSLHYHVYHSFANHIPDTKFASLSYALLYVAFWWVVLWIMSILKWSIRV
jgi:predicted acyltransferase